MDPNQLTQTQLQKMKKADIIAHCISCQDELHDWRKICPDINDPDHMEFFWEEMEGKINDFEKLKEELAHLKGENGEIREWKLKCGKWREKFMILERSVRKHDKEGTPVSNDYKQ